MPTPTKGPRLGGGPAHERHILANLASALFEHDSITTTEAKAKRMRPLAERLITFAKRGDLHARRQVMTTIGNKSVVHRLFVEIAPDMADRPGGYTRITKVGARKGDNAPMAVIELVREPVAKKAVVAEAEGATKRATKEAAGKKAAAKDATADAADGHVGTDAEAAAPVALVDLDADVHVGSDDAASAVSLPTGAVAPLEDGSAPEGFLVKGNADSGLYHEPDGQWYDATVAEFWFATAAEAEAAGFTKAGAKASKD